jgi:hypothetical protein
MSTCGTLGRSKDVDTKYMTTKRGHLNPKCKIDQRVFKTLWLMPMFTLPCLFLHPSSASAKTFRNAYVSFELGDKWNCTLEQTEWVCRTTDPGLAEAIIVLTAKEVGPSDSLPSYETHLKTARTIMTKSGQSLQSTVYEVKQQNIHNQPWVNGFHYSSEALNYYTRYLATIKDRVAVLVTFSAHKLHYTKYSAEFFHAIESLNVIATPSLWKNKGGPAGGGVGMTGGPTGLGEFPSEETSGDLDGGEGAGDATKAFLAIAIILGGAGAYMLLKRKKSKKKL